MDDLNFYFSVGIGVQTDCSTPALARFGSDFVKQEFLKPALTGFQDPTYIKRFFPLIRALFVQIGDMVTCIGVSEPSGGSDVASIKSKAVSKGNLLVVAINLNTI